MQNIVIIPKKHKDKVREYFDKYLTYLHQFVPHIEFDENGRPKYRWWDYFWTEKNRLPFALKIDGHFAGFCLMREENPDTFEIAEFYILPKYQGYGHGTWFAHEIIKIFDTDLKLSTSTNNIKAVEFWSKVTSKYPTTITKDEKWTRYLISKGDSMF